MDNYEFAKRLAGVAHYKQHYGSKPYTYHFAQVEKTLCDFGYKDDMDLIISAWLHDVIEDCGLSYDQIKFGFGETIADIVYAVTNEMGRNRKERNIKTYPKIKTNKKAIILKLADRIVNITMAIGTNTRYIEIYRSEMKFFTSSLYEKTDDERVEKMWEHLKELFNADTTEKI